MPKFYTLRKTVELRKGRCDSDLRAADEDDDSGDEGPPHMLRSLGGAARGLTLHSWLPGNPPTPLPIVLT